MSTQPTAKLYVRLSASQVRKRLKSVGLGVRRIEAVGRRCAVIHHTATGDHLRDLEALLADVLTTPEETRPSQVCRDGE